MRNFKRHITAILTAAVITLSAAGTVSAHDKEVLQYTGWVTSGEYWQYLVDGEPYVGVHKVDGLMCYFTGYYMGAYSGWKNDRFYKDGLPFTGWTDNGRSNEMREEYYCVGGCKVTGDFPVGGKIYSFDKNGRYTGKSRDARVIVSCGEKISDDAEKITFTIENLNDESRKFKIAKSFEYLKNGKWVSCKNGTVFYSALDKGLSKKGGKLSFEVDVQEYARNKFKEGFYRLPVTCGEETYYAVFEAVAPIEVKSAKDEYVFGNYDGSLAIKPANTINLNLTVYSAKEELQTDIIKDKIRVKIEQKTQNGWEAVEDIGYDIAVGSEKNSLTITPYFYSDEGHYRAAVIVGGKKYTETFRIRNHIAAPWLDEYDLNDDDITISFNVGNTSDETITVDTNVTMLYKKCGGKYSIYEGVWETAASENFTGEFDIAEKELKSKKHITVNFDLSHYYDTSKLEAGEYAVRIDGIGFAEFTLTDKPREKNLPFKDLKAEDVKEIIIEDNAWSLRQTAAIKPGSAKTEITDTDKSEWREITASAQSSDHLNRSIAYLRQFEVKDRYRNYDDGYVGGNSSITVVYKDGTKTELFFQVSDAVRLDGKWYHCGGYAEPACMAVVKELAARNLPFEDIKEDDLKEIRLENRIDNTVYSEELKQGNTDFHNAVINLNHLELKDACENSEIPTGDVLTVKLFYTDGTEETLSFHTSNAVVMPDGKAYYCRDNFYKNITYMFFYKYYGELEADTT